MRTCAISVKPSTCEEGVDLSLSEREERTLCEEGLSRVRRFANRTEMSFGGWREVGLEIKKFCQTSPKGEKGRNPARDVGEEGRREASNGGRLANCLKGPRRVYFGLASAAAGEGTFRSESRGRPKWVRTTSCFDDRTHCFEWAKGLCGTGIGCGGG